MELDRENAVIKRDRENRLREQGDTRIKDKRLLDAFKMTNDANERQNLLAFSEILESEMDAGVKAELSKLKPLAEISPGAALSAAQSIVSSRQAAMAERRTYQEGRQEAGWDRQDARYQSGRQAASAAPASIRVSREFLKGAGYSDEEIDQNFGQDDELTISGTRGELTEWMSSLGQ